MDNTASITVETVEHAVEGVDTVVTVQDINIAPEVRRTALLADGVTIDPRGGARRGAGRPAGSTNKITYQDILSEIHRVHGKEFAQLLAEGYYGAIVANDRPVRQKYELMILNKVVADKTSIDITSQGESLTTRQAAFAAIISNIKEKHDAAQIRHQQEDAATKHPD